MQRENLFNRLALPAHILEKKIIIIGAGMAGLTCAEKLQKRCFTNVKVLEATDRLGGRLYSWGCRKRAEGTGWTYFEMGAQRVTAGSTIHKIARKHRQIDTDAPDYGQVVENFELIYDKNECAAINSLKKYLCDRLYFPKDFNEILEDRAFLAVFQNSERDLIQCMKKMMKGVYNWWWHGMAYEYVFNTEQYELTFGYSGVLQTIVRRLSNNTVISNKEVMKIDYTDFWNANIAAASNALKIKVFCKDGSIFEADHVIVTIPLGYLKEHFMTLFSPPLPEDKITAIQSLNFITVNKIFLEYAEPFWEDGDVYHVIWNENLDELFRYHVHPGGQDSMKWLPFINRFEYVYTQPKVLCALIWGEGAEIMEQLTLEEVACCCTVLLRHLLKKMVPMPVNVNRSMWHSNSLFRGSLVYDPGRSVHRHLKTLSESISFKGELLLQFAGDATCESGIMSSVHGARKSGTRAARELYVQCAAEAGACFENADVYSDSD